eukprot:Platyproteum_vivax@DN829_c0_g1_i1.p1
MSVVWMVFAFGVVPTGLVLAFLLLSGFCFLEKFGSNICNIPIKIGLVRIRLITLLLTVSVLLCASEAVKLRGMIGTRRPTMALEDRFKMELWLHQRNWWMSIFSCVLWTVVWRMSYLVKVYRDQITYFETDPSGNDTDKKTSKGSPKGTFY